MEDIGTLWSRVADPARSFPARRAEAPALRVSLKEMLLLRSPLAFLALAFEYASFRSLYGRLSDPSGDLWTTILRSVPGAPDPADLKVALARLPELPSTHGLLPWFLLASPLVVLSVWAHDVTFDHVALWVLRGLGGDRSWRATMTADAEALKAGVFGSAFGILFLLPFLPAPLVLVQLPVAGYFWILRGFALAAWHGVPLWKGVAATLVHVLLVILLFGGMLLACLLLVILMAS
jgi:hypothetical protein